MTLHVPQAALWAAGGFALGFLTAITITRVMLARLARTVEREARRVQGWP